MTDIYSNCTTAQPSYAGCAAKNCLFMNDVSGLPSCTTFLTILTKRCGKIREPRKKGFVACFFLFYFIKLRRLSKLSNRVYIYNEIESLDAAQPFDRLLHEVVHGCARAVQCLVCLPGLLAWAGLTLANRVPFLPLGFLACFLVCLVQHQKGCQSVKQLLYLGQSHQPKEQQGQWLHVQAKRRAAAHP